MSRATENNLLRGPGAPAAVEAGCLCPELANAPRVLEAELVTLVAPDCPLHAEESGGAHRRGPARW